MSVPKAANWALSGFPGFPDSCARTGLPYSESCVDWIDLWSHLAWDDLTSAWGHSNWGDLWRHLAWMINVNGVCQYMYMVDAVSVSDDFYVFDNLELNVRKLKFYLNK